jgi:hypothetical protein
MSDNSCSISDEYEYSFPKNFRIAISVRRDITFRNLVSTIPQFVVLRRSRFSGLPIVATGSLAAAAYRIPKASPSIMAASNVHLFSAEFAFRRPSIVPLCDSEIVDRKSKRSLRSLSDHGCATGAGRGRKI